MFIKGKVVKMQQKGAYIETEVEIPAQTLTLSTRQPAVEKIKEGDNITINVQPYNIMEVK